MCDDFQMEKKAECFVCTRDAIKETVFKGQTLNAWLEGPKDKDGKPMQDEDGTVIKGFKANMMFNGPTLVSRTTKKMLIGTGVYKDATVGNLEKTFG